MKSSISWNGMWSDINGVSNYEVFKEKMKNSLLPLSDELMKTLFDLITRTRGTRAFKWVGHNIIVGNIEPILLDTFNLYQWINKFLIDNKDVRSMYSSYQLNKIFGLPSEQITTPDSALESDVTNQYTTNSGLAKSRDKGIDIIGKVIKVNSIYQEILTNVSKMFSPFLEQTNQLEINPL